MITTLYVLGLAMVMAPIAALLIIIVTVLGLASITEDDTDADG